MSIIVDRAKSKDLNHLGFAFGFLLSYKRQLVIASVALLFTSAITLGLGQGLRMMVDEGFYSGQLEHLTRTALIFVGLALLLGLGTFIRHYYVSWLGERTVADLRQHVFSRLIYLDPGFFEHNLSGEIQTRITTDTTIIQNVIGSSASVALRNSLTLIGGAAMMILTDWKLSLIILICVPLMIGPILLLGRGVRRYSLTTQDRMAKLGAFVGESIGHIKTVQAFNHQSHDIQSFTEVVESTFAAAKTRIVYRSFLIAMVMSGLLIAIAGILWVGGMDVINNRISIGQLVAFGFYAFLVAMSLASISEIFSELQKAAGATQRLCELATAKSTLHLPQNPMAIPTQCRGQLTFSNLHFAYPARPDYHAINNLQLEIQPGESLALVGPSGAGKTTLFDLILRYYDPLQGDILLDGVSIRDLKLEDLRNLIAIVPQEPALFTTSVLENIRYSKPQASREEVKAAAHAAYASDFIAELPEGFDTFLGEKGARLSGGQKQRIAIARAILKNPKILLLDEATSALDAKSEKQVQRAIDDLMKNRTTLIIAHRLATVRHVNRIAVLDHGSLVATGSHDELMQTSPLYNEFARLQFHIQNTP